MNLRQKLSAGILAIAVIGATAVISYSQGLEDVDPHLHPNLAKAQHSIDQALGLLTDAQRANEFDMEGHTAKAKELLVQADREIKQGALMANKNKK